MMNSSITTNVAMPASPNTNNGLARTVPRLSSIEYPDVCLDGESESRTHHGSPSTSGSHRKALHHSSPALRTDTCFPPMVEAASRSNPTMSTFKGMSRIKPQCSQHQQNASFLHHHHHHHDRRSSLTMPRTATGKPACRNTMVALDKIVQRSSSKSVKQTLRQLEAMCGGGDAQQGTPPWREVEMLLELSTDIYYRVVMKKCRGMEIVTALRQTFPQLEGLCDQLLKAMDIPDESAPSPRSTRTTVLLDPNMETSSMDSMQVDHETSEDMRQIIQDGCQNIIW